MPATIHFKEHLIEVLKQDKRLLDDDNVMIYHLLDEYIRQYDETILQLLLNDERCKAKLFAKVGNAYIFKAHNFRLSLQKEHYRLSHEAYGNTNYANQIGLRVGKKLLKYNKDVVLDFPYKDCVLKGGQTKTEQKRRELFFNEIVAKDEIDKLLEPKAFADIMKYDSNGSHKPTAFNRNEKGTITDNLIIKGNNLLALHSLKREFAGKVKLIYIDPPYNTGTDTFQYNDNFNHSTWLVFIKNRLEVAKKLLSEDGVIFVQCDHHEMAYLNVILDETFGVHNKIQQIAVKVASPSGFKAVNPGPIDVLENILFYAKNKKKAQLKKNYVTAQYHKNYNKYLDKISSDVSTWKLISIKEKVLKVNGFNNEREFRQKNGKNYKIVLQQMIEDFAFKNAENVVSIRYLHKPTKQVNSLPDKSRLERNVIFIYEKQNGEHTYIINGGALAFYSAKKRKINGKMCITELLSNFWQHISWAGIAQEGNVKLKNGKKPEKLLKQILELGTNEDDIVLDFFVGSGTTAAVAHKMNRQYISIEQLDEHIEKTKIRLQNVIAGEQKGISKFVNWKGGGSFTYLSLAKHNEEAKEHILSCTTLTDLQDFFESLKTDYFLHYDYSIKKFENEVLYSKAFASLDIAEQQAKLCNMLDRNQMYVNLSEMEDELHKMSAEDIALTKDFYQISE